jgi:hypothetical protein
MTEHRSTRARRRGSIRSRPLSRICLGLIVAGVVAIAGATPASALVDTCSAPAYTGCTTSTHTYIESRSQKSGAAADYICTWLGDGAGYVGNCLYNTTFIRICNYTQDLRYGLHYGSSNAWTISGRDATASDATTC